MQRVIERWGTVLARKGWGVWLVGIVLTAMGFMLRDKWGEIVDGALVAGLIVVLLPIFRSYQPIQSVFAFLGRHSMNIFMIHTFICSYYFPDWIRSFGNPWGQFAVLLGCSLAVSCALEVAKKNSGIAKLGKSLLAWISRVE